MLPSTHPYTFLNQLRLFTLDCQSKVKKNNLILQKLTCWERETSIFSVFYLISESMKILFYTEIFWSHDFMCYLNNQHTYVLWLHQVSSKLEKQILSTNYYRLSLKI